MHLVCVCACMCVHAFVSMSECVWVVIDEGILIDILTLTFVSDTNTLRLSDPEVNGKDPMTANTYDVSPFPDKHELKKKRLQLLQCY